MIRNKYLNDLKEGLETWFKYDPEGPRTLCLNFETASALLNLLTNLDQLEIKEIIDPRMTNNFPRSDIEQWVKSTLARKLVDKLLEDGYVKFFTEESIDNPLEQIFRATVTILKEDL